MNNNEINIEDKKADDELRRESGEFVPRWEKATESGVILYNLYKAGERDVDVLIEALERKAITGYSRSMVCMDITSMAKDVYGNEEFVVEI